jgi:DNA-binding GntR family transcriptional regulator
MIDKEDIRNLEGLLTAQKQLDARQIKEWQSLNHKFHTTINLKCGNDRLIRLLRQNLRFTTFWFLVLSSPGRILQSIEEHEKILDALVRRDADQSRRLVESHIISVGRYLLDSACEIVPMGMWREDG